MTSTNDRDSLGKALMMGSLLLVPLSSQSPPTDGADRQTDRRQAAARTPPGVLERPSDGEPAWKELRNRLGMLESAKDASRRDLAVRRQTASGEVVHGRGSGLRALGTACWPPE